MKIFLIIPFFVVSAIRAEINTSGVDKYIAKLNEITLEKDVEKQVYAIELEFLDLVKGLQQECEEDFLTLRLGTNRSSKARLTSKEKKVCLSKAEGWSRQFRSAKFDIRKKALKIIHTEQLKALDKMQDSVPINK